MLHSVRVSRDGSLVLSSFSGVLSEEDVFQLEIILTRTEGIAEKGCGLVDLREVQKTSLSFEAIERIVRFEARFPAVFGGRRNAIVAKRDEVFGMSRMYDAYSECRGDQVQVVVFRSYDDALNWLEVGPEELSNLGINLVPPPPETVDATQEGDSESALVGSRPMPRS